MKFILIGADGISREAVPNGVPSAGNISAIIAIDSSGNVIQLTKEQLMSYLGGDLTLNDLIVEGDLTAESDLNANGGVTVNEEVIIRSNGSIALPTLADESAANNSMYYSSDAEAYVIKDAAGVVHEIAFV